MILVFTHVLLMVGLVCLKGFISSSWAVDDFVVAASLASIHYGWIRVHIVHGVGIRIWACSFEGPGSVSGNASTSVCVIAAISWSTSETVWRLAEAIQIGDGAAQSSAMWSIAWVSVSVGGVDHQREIVTVLQALSIFEKTS